MAPSSSRRVAERVPHSTGIVTPEINGFDNELRSEPADFGIGRRAVAGQERNSATRSGIGVASQHVGPGVAGGLDPLGLRVHSATRSDDGCPPRSAAEKLLWPMALAASTMMRCSSRTLARPVREPPRTVRQHHRVGPTARQPPQPDGSRSPGNDATAPPGYDHFCRDRHTTDGASPPR